MSREDEATLAALAAELHAARHTGVSTRDIDGRIDACIREIKRTSISN